MRTPSPPEPAHDDSGLELDWGDRRREVVAPASEEPAAPAPLPPVEAYVRPPPAVWHHADEDALLERRLRRVAVPLALGVAWLFVQTGMGRFFAKIFAGMWLHELGHASAAWLCSVFALPGPWKTMVGEERSVLVALFVLAAIGYGAHRLWSSERRELLWIPVVLLVAQSICSLGLRPSRVQAFITFSGDGGALVYGALLICTFYARASSSLRTGWLRWGFLVLGSLAFMSTADTWWRAVSDVDAIPFGEIEGVGTSDPVRLTDDYGWSIPGMVRAYVTVSLLALLTVAALYLRGWFAPVEDEES